MQYGWQDLSTAPTTRAASNANSAPSCSVAETQQCSPALPGLGSSWGIGRYGNGSGSQASPTPMPGSTSATAGLPAVGRPVQRATAAAGATVAARQRPAGGAAPARKAAASDPDTALLDQLRRPVASWSVQEVCVWIKWLGLGQYRPRLVHHCVSGGLLLRLRPEQLKADLGIGPLGHREGLLQAIDDLRRCQQSLPGDGHAQGAESGHTQPACQPSHQMRLQHRT